MTINIYPRAVFLFTVEISGVVGGEVTVTPPGQPLVSVECGGCSQLVVYNSRVVVIVYGEQQQTCPQDYITQQN